MGDRLVQNMETLDELNGKAHPLTIEQLRYFEEAQSRAVHTAVNRVRKSAVIGFLILLLGIGFNIWDNKQQGEHSRHAIVNSGRVVSVAGCNRDFHTITATRGVLIAAKKNVRAQEKAGRFTKDQADDAVTFYNTQLGKLTLPDCRLARTIVTDDPDKLRPIPTPLYVPKK
jgi:hypothetical protein